ncbi:MAG: M20/M25/M40 family metallo-hydrolase [Kordiimonadaceae bacterium]|nr:M20/M25/M40 family metallo-hydrolase [Kordiimonadaceae bacterium]
MRNFVKAVAMAAVATSAAFAAEKVDLDIINKIRDEGFNHSQVMETLEHLTDTIGHRLTGSPSMLEANNWTKEKLTEWGLENAHLEGFKFGPGWTMQNVEVYMAAPRRTQLYAIPIAWHPGTNGVVEAEVIHAPMASPDDFAEYKGKLKGKIVLVSDVPDQREPSNKVFTKHNAKSLAGVEQYKILLEKPYKEIEGWVKRVSFKTKLEHFLAEEGAVALVRRSWRKSMLLEGLGYQHKPEFAATIPGIDLAYEHYTRAVRLLESGKTVKFSLKTEVTFHRDDLNSYSTFAEIPGKGRNPEIVMAGGHLDSWVAADGAVDNGAGVAVAMEAVRILKAIGVKPKRTIRVGLWSGEEQGYYGSFQYVIDHLATRPENTKGDLKYMEPYAKAYGQFPIKVKAGHKRFSAYFNLDNGGGKIRGIYTQGNAAVAPIFKAWFAPFHDLGAKTISSNNTSGTDHEPFDEVGLPAFQFIQDGLDYGSRLHHTQLDTFGNTYEKNLKQSAVIIASFLYNAAMRDEKLPRKPMPRPIAEDEEIEEK